MAAQCSHEDTGIQLRQKCETAYIPVLTLLATVNQLPTL